MTNRFLILFAALATSLWGQRTTDRRTAEIRGGGESKCTIEVEVDGVAEVEIRGDSASIRTISGAPARFRRFQCGEAMPSRPYGFRFEGVDGRGRQEMVRSADDGGRAIIRIDDSKGGSDGYTFDIFWSGGSGGRGGSYDSGRYRSSGGRSDLRDVVGMSLSSGMTEMSRRGYRLARTETSGSELYNYFRNDSSNRCVSVHVVGGRYDSIVDTLNADCDRNSRGSRSSSNVTDANNLQDLVGIRARDGESQLKNRGYRLVRNVTQGEARVNYWQRGSQCVAVEVYDGKYSYLNSVPNNQCR